jgi:hypothetical protein
MGMRLVVGLSVMLVLGCGPRPTMRPQPSAGGAPTVPELDASERCGPFSPDTLMACVDEKRIERVVREIAKPWPAGGEQRDAVRKLCASELEAAGYHVSLHDYGTGINVIGTKAGFSKPAQQVIVSAHYDALRDCPGANDNASGVAVVLETARVLAQARFDRTLLVACWDEGERGQVGSAAYATEARSREDNIVAMVAYEAVAYASEEPDSQTIPERFEELFPDQALAMLDTHYRANFLTVVAETATEPSAQAMARYGDSVQLPVHVLTLTESVKRKQRKLHRSDHASFWDANYPALLVTDTGRFRNERVHCRKGQDTPDSLDFRFAARSAKASLGAVVELLQLR